MVKKLQKKTVLISGAGPSALLSAYEARKVGHNVILVNNRNLDFVRIQRVLVDAISRKILLDMLPLPTSIYNKEDAKFIRELCNETTIAIKDIERFLKRRLDESTVTSGNLTYKTFSEISRIDMRTGFATIASLENHSEETIVQFDYLIGADGSKHHAANLMIDSVGKHIFNYDSVAAPKHTEHASIYFTIERKDGQTLLLPALQFIEATTQLANSTHDESLLWAASIDKPSHLKSYGRSVKVTFAGEVPTEVFTAITHYKTGSEQGIKSATPIIINYLKHIMLSYFTKHGLDNGELIIKFNKASRKHGIAKDHMKIQCFDNQHFQKANKAMHEEYGRKFILIGDAYRTPNYQFGHGLNHALLHAHNLRELFEGTMTPQQYNLHSNNLSRVIGGLTNVFNHFGKLGSKFLVSIGERRTERLREDYLKKNPLNAKLKANLPGDKLKDLMIKLQIFRTNATNLFQPKVQLALENSSQKPILSNASFSSVTLSHAINAFKESIYQSALSLYHTDPQQHEQITALININLLVDSLLKVLKSHAITKNDYRKINKLAHDMQQVLLFFKYNPLAAKNSLTDLLREAKSNKYHLHFFNHRKQNKFDKLLHHFSQTNPALNSLFGRKF